MTPTLDALQRAADTLAAQIDEALKVAITERLGRDGWTLQELRPRLSLSQQCGTERYFLDGAPLLTVHPLCLHELSTTRSVWTRDVQTYTKNPAP